MPLATTTGTMFFSLAMVDNKENFQEALSSYKEARRMLSQAEPLLRILSKEVIKPSG